MCHLACNVSHSIQHISSIFIPVIKSDVLVHLFEASRMVLYMLVDIVSVLEAILRFRVENNSACMGVNFRKLYFVFTEDDYREMYSLTHLSVKSFYNS